MLRFVKGLTVLQRPLVFSDSFLIQHHRIPVDKHCFVARAGPFLLLLCFKNLYRPGKAVRAGDNDKKSDLGNGGESHGYAIAGVEFTYLKVADIIQFTESDADGITSDHVEVLYGIDKTAGADLLNTLGLKNGAQRYANADQLDTSKYFYQGDILMDALAAALEANATKVKNALETYIADHGGTAMDLTNAYGKTAASGLPLGLYLCCETACPEMVVSTINPFFISLPMTSISGGNDADGGTDWI